jgi:hypothetical protein
LEPRADERKATCVLSEEEMRSMPARTDCEGVRLVDWWERARITARALRDEGWNKEAEQRR